MIKKEKLLNRIDILVELEKRLTPLLSKHVSSSLFSSNLKKEDRDEITERFQNMVIAQKKHIEILDGIKEEVKKGKNDVY